MLPQQTGFQDGLNLTISLCLVYTLCMAGLRVWIRKTGYGADDIVIAASTLITLAHTACDYVALKEGLGLPWANLTKDTNLHGLNQASIAGVVTFIIALYLSKCAMLSFLARITKSKSQILLYHIINGIIGAAGLASVLIAVAGCSAESEYYWAFHANRHSCPGQSIRWQAITGIDIITEIVVLVLPVHLVWGLQMPLTKKAMLIVAFYLRLPALGFSIARNYYTLQLRLPSTDEGLDSTLVVIWLEIQLTYALAASTLSALKAFTANFNSRFGLGFTRGKGEGSYGMADVSGGNTGQSSKHEDKSKMSTADSGADIIRIRSPEPESGKSSSSPTETDDTLNSSPKSLKLRPEHKFKCVTHVCAQPMMAPVEGRFPPGRTLVGSDDRGSMGIFHEQSYAIHSSPKRTYLLRP